MEAFFRSIRKDLFDGVQVQSAFFPPTALRCTLVFWQVSSTKHGRAGRVFRPRWRSGQRSPKRSTRVTDLYRTPAASSDLATSTGSISDR